jgi:5-(carboxyamino)imidazole ribonucleotide synthase
MIVGVLGAGQLGRMLGLAGLPLGLTFRFFDPDPDACAAPLGTLFTHEWLDMPAIERFARGCDVITYEFENVPVEAVRAAQRFAPVYPPPEALEIGQNRLREKTLFVESGLRVHPFVALERADQGSLREALRHIGLPCVVKTLRGGYDGKGQAVVRSEQDVPGAAQELAGRPLLVEQFIAFERELSLIGVRGRDGAFDAYPLTQNRHERGILRESIAPAPHVDQRLAAETTQHMRTLMTRLSYVGVLAIEFFVARNAQGEQTDKAVLLANEMAPRVHNSGHWTIDGAHASQFENHLRAICGLPLAPCTARGTSVMVNFIGRVPDRSALTRVPAAKLHLYGKEGRPGRKVAHATIVGPHDATGEDTQAPSLPLSLASSLAQLQSLARACDQPI